RLRRDVADGASRMWGLPLHNRAKIQDDTRAAINRVVACIEHPLASVPVLGQLRAHHITAPSRSYHEAARANSTGASSCSTRDTRLSWSQGRTRDTVRREDQAGGGPAPYLGGGPAAMAGGCRQ